MIQKQRHCTECVLYNGAVFTFGKFDFGLFGCQLLINFLFLEFRFAGKLHSKFTEA